MKTKLKRLAILATLFLSAILIFVGREAASRRPVWLQKGGLQALVKHQEWEKPAISDEEFDALRARLKIGENDVFAVSDDRKWFVRRGKINGKGTQFAVRAIADGKLRCQFTTPSTAEVRAEFSPDAQLLFTGDIDSGRSDIFDAQTGKFLWTCYEALRFTPDGKNVVATIGKSISTRNARTGKEIYRVEIPTKKTLGDFWFDGPNHVKIVDFDDNLWRVRIR